ACPAIRRTRGGRHSSLTASNCTPPSCRISKVGLISSALPCRARCSKSVPFAAPRVHSGYDLVGAEHPGWQRLRGQVFSKAQGGATEPTVALPPWHSRRLLAWRSSPGLTLWSILTAHRSSPLHRWNAPTSSLAAPARRRPSNTQPATRAE